MKRMGIFGLAAIASLGILASGVGQASATTCSGEINSPNGTTSLPGTNIGTVQSGCQIGVFGGAAGSINGSGSFVNDQNNPSIYEFTWGGGNLTIQEEQGSNGIGYNINVELGLVSGVTLNTSPTVGGDTNPNAGNLLGTLVASISIPQATQATPEYVLNNVNLAAGTYALDTYLGTCAAGHSCSDSGDGTDPEYAVLFTASATPLPATLPLFAGGLGIVGFLTRRKKRDARALAAA